MGKVLTVSIAAYQVEDTIERALESLLDDRINDDIEIFVVDDGGKDGTLAIAQKFAEKYPNTVYPIHKENGGYGSTINASLGRATGKYFKQLDGDDWFIKENFIELVQLLKTVDVDCVITEVADYRVSTAQLTQNEAFASLSEGQYRFDDTRLDSILTMHGSAIRTDIFRDHHIVIIEKCFYSDTELVVLPMPYMETFYLWKKPVYVYFIGVEGQSMSLSGIEKHYPDHEKVFWELIDAYAKIDARSKEKRDLVLRRLVKEAIFHIEFLCCLPIGYEHYREVKAFGERLRKDYPEIYGELLKKRKMTKLMWRSRYLAYPIMAVVTRRKYKNRSTT